ncbi:MAG: hypothetical protein J5861_01045 [Desulfovibrio sp.]|nr:hypothetical protein [Desulfovibrio sp.]
MTKTSFGIVRAWLRIGMILLSCVCLPCVGYMQAYASTVPFTLDKPCAPLLPYLDYYIDVTGTMDVEEIATAANATAFRPLNIKELPDVVGVTWLRFTLAPLPAGKTSQVTLLDLGQNVPAGAVLYEPRLNPATDGLEWREIPPGDRNLLLLPEAGTETRPCYIRLDGLPGIWFSPMLRTPQNAAVDLTRHSGKAALLALCVVMALCLLRWLSEKGQWRVWTVLYVGMALVQGVMGTPAYGAGGITSGQAAAILSPGLALMLLPHVGRHLMGTRERSRALDVQFVLLTLPGAVLALLPLLPGFGWTIRYLHLWPAGTLLFVPTALCAAVMGLGGARRFLLGCLIPPLFVAAGFLGMDSGLALDLLASAPLWGTALSAMLIAGLGLPSMSSRNEVPASTSGVIPLDKMLTVGMDDTPIPLEQPLDDPNLRLLPPMDTKSSASPDTLTNNSTEKKNVPVTVTTSSVSDYSAWEQSLRPPLDRLMREGAALGSCSLPPAVRQYAENMLRAAGELAQLVDNPGKTVEQNQDREQLTTFNLQHLIREAHDTVTAAAENAGIGLAWYMPPLLSHMYEGQAQALRETLDLLLESAVRATSQGAVNLSVRRMPGSNDPGYLLFTVSDTGSGIPPSGRSSLALTRAWELAGSNGGYLNVECGPQGASISFTLHLKSLEGMDTEGTDAHRRKPTIAVVADNAVMRQTLAHMITELSCRSTEARSMQEALQVNRESPALMVVVQPAHNSPAEADALGRFEAEAMQSGLPLFKALAITPNDSQWDSLAERGYTHALLEPLDTEAFAATVREVLQEAGFSIPADSSKETEAKADTPLQTVVPDLFSTDSTPEPVIPGDPREAESEESTESNATAHSSPPKAEVTVSEPLTPDVATGCVNANQETTGLPLPIMDDPVQTSETNLPTSEPGNEFVEAAAMDGPQWDGNDSVANPSEENDQILSEITPEPENKPSYDPQDDLENPLASSEKGDVLTDANFPATGITASMRTWHDSFDEWVGEPMPVEVEHDKNTTKVAERKASTSHSAATSTVSSSYVSPSLSASGEWVGEPMPIIRDAKIPESPITGELPHTDAGRRILKLLGSAGDVPQRSANEERKDKEQTPAFKNVPEAKARNREEDASNSLLNFIAGASEESAENLPQPTPHADVQREPSHALPQQGQAPSPSKVQSGQEFQSQQVDTNTKNANTPKSTEKTPSDQTIPQLINRLETAMRDAQEGFTNRRCMVVGEAAGRIASESDTFGFRVLARMARCVERAAKAEDLQALQDLLPELATAVERNRIALTPRALRKSA